MIYNQSMENELQQMVNFIHQNYRRKIKVSDIAREGAVCKSRCFELFKAQTGQTVNEYLNNVRIHNAEILLREGKKSLGEISDLCGFKNQSYFSTVFLRKYGVTPFEYRRSHSEIPENPFFINSEAAYALQLLSKDYLKILKINLEDETYEIIHINQVQLPESFIAKNNIGGYFKEFLCNSDIIPEDRNEFEKIINVKYLKDFFSEHYNGRYLKVNYQRKVMDSFIPVQLQVACDPGYGKKNQILYLYIKKL